MPAPVTVNLHATAPRSRANGPGVRFVLWFQGCSLGCPGCFNPATHAGAARDVRDVDSVVAEILAAADARSGDRGDAPDVPLEGITLTGGEPFEQPRAALAILDRVRAETDLSTLAFSGFTIDEVRARPRGPDILARLDVLIDGRYDAPLRIGVGLRGSANQRVHLLTDRYRADEVAATPTTEIRIARDGTVVLTGVDPLVLGAKHRR